MKMTNEEASKYLIKRIQSNAEYWLEIAQERDLRPEVLVDSLIYSILSLLDGKQLNFPKIGLMSLECTDDKDLIEYYEEQGLKYFDDKTFINDIDDNLSYLWANKDEE